MIQASSTDPTKCKMRIHYHMYGEKVRALKVYQRVQNGGPWTKIWSKSGDKGSLWNSNAIKMNMDSGIPFQVLLISL